MYILLYYIMFYYIILYCITLHMYYTIHIYIYICRYTTLYDYYYVYDTRWFSDMIHKALQKGRDSRHLSGLVRCRFGLRKIIGSSAIPRHENVSKKASRRKCLENGGCLHQLMGKWWCSCSSMAWRMGKCMISCCNFHGERFNQWIWGSPMASHGPSQLVNLSRATSDRRPPARCGTHRHPGYRG